MAQKLQVIHIEGYLIACLAHILLAVHLPLAAAGLLFEAQRPEHRSTILLRPDMKVLPVHGGDYLHVLDQPVALRLLMKLCDIPVFGDVIDLSQCRAPIVLQVLFDEQLSQVHRLEKRLGSSDCLDTAGRLLVSVDPDILPGGILDVSFGSGWQGYVRHYSLLKLVIEASS